MYYRVAGCKPYQKYSLLSGNEKDMRDQRATLNRLAHDDNIFNLLKVSLPQANSANTPYP